MSKSIMMFSPRRLLSLAKHRWPQLWRYVKFCIVGGSGVLVDMAILFLLNGNHGWNLGLLANKVIAAEIAVANNFLWNEAWTFRGSSPCRHSRVLSFLKFNLISAVGIALSVILLRLGVYGLGLNVYLANFCAIF